MVRSYKSRGNELIQRLLVSLATDLNLDRDFPKEEEKVEGFS